MVAVLCNYSNRMLRYISDLSTMKFVFFCEKQLVKLTCRTIFADTRIIIWIDINTLLTIITWIYRTTIDR